MYRKTRAEIDEAQHIKECNRPQSYMKPVTGPDTATINQDAVIRLPDDANGNCVYVLASDNSWQWNDI